MKNQLEELEKQCLILAEWMQGRSNVSAQVWRYHISHSHFGLILQGTDTNERLYLHCVGCERFESRANWDNAKVELCYFEGEFRKVVLQDVNAGLRIQCAGIRIQKDTSWLFEDAEYSSKDTSPLDPKVNSMRFAEMNHRRIDMDSRQHSPEDLEDFLRGRLEELGEYKAQFWSYRADENRLDICVKSTQFKSNLHILCGNCNYFKLEMYEQSNLRLQHPDSNVRYLLQSADGRWLVECDFILLTNNVMPIM